MGKIMDKIKSWTEKQKIKHEVKREFALDIADKIVNRDKYKEAERKEIGEKLNNFVKANEPTKELKETVEGAKLTVDDINGIQKEEN